jgi:hypothetical protein
MQFTGHTLTQVASLQQGCVITYAISEVLLSAGVVLERGIADTGSSGRSFNEIG